MMDATGILERLDDAGVAVTVAGDRLQLEPGSQVPPGLVEELRQHKREVISLLKLKGYSFKYPETQTTRREAQEIARRVDHEGYVLLWSRVLCDLVVFYRDEDCKSKIPPGFVPYSKAELTELFGDKAPSEHTLKLIHEAKKQGGRVIDVERPGTSQEWNRD